MPDPLEHVRPGEPVSAKRWNALVDYVRSITARGSFPVEVHRGPGGSVISLALSEPTALVELTSALATGGTATAKILWHNGTSWIDSGIDVITVHDVMLTMQGSINARALVKFHRQSGKWLVWQLQC